ncbi:MAG: hypothetical protein SFY66_16010 [Oculatellaceae cyanobacterium bins.114]|nr:hypothetical protein [Oculatellaceae cyanobacterium bins.114]
MALPEFERSPLHITFYLSCQSDPLPDLIHYLSHYLIYLEQIAIHPDFKVFQTEALTTPISKATQSIYGIG